MILLIIIMIMVHYKYVVAPRKRYEQTEYYKSTKTSYNELRFDKGKDGEYLTYKNLVEIPEYKKFLFNSYIPKTHGNTTEIDLIMINEAGIHIFESKNYSGWIFGSESNQYWTQSLYCGDGRVKTHKFYNPIMQNVSHLKWLKEYLSEFGNVNYFTYVVFSNKCEFKNMDIINNKNKVTTQRNVYSVVYQNTAENKMHLSDERIDKIYNKLYPRTQVSDEIKAVHIQAIKNNLHE